MASHPPHKGLWSKDPEGWIYGPPFPEAPSWRVAVKLDEIAGIPQITALKIEPLEADLPLRRAATPEEAVVTHDRLRRLPLRRIAELAATGGDWAKFSEFVYRQINAWPQRGRRRPDDHYAEVAEVYRAALRRREPPRQAVAERWGVKEAMASRYIAKARELKLLGPAPKVGVGGEVGRPKKSRTRTVKGGSK